MKHLIDKSLCTRCGACFAIDENSFLKKDNEGYPVTTDDNYDKSKYINVCSGENWNYKQLLYNEYGRDVKYNPLKPDIGIHTSVLLVSSANAKLRKRGQSGGVTTTLLGYAMDTGYIDSVLCVRRPKLKNIFSAEPFIAKNKEELLESCGSKYTICSVLDKIYEIAKCSDKFAITTLPCQTAGFKRLSTDHDPTLKEKCKLIIGPFCGMNMDKIMGPELVGALKINSENIKAFQNRGGDFPGKTVINLKSGPNVYLDRTAHRLFYRMFSPIRCYTCTDYGNELADLSVADCWKKDYNGFIYPEGAAYVICRSSRGKQLLNAAINAGVLNSYEFNVEKQKESWEPGFLYRKVQAHNRIRYLKKRGYPVPKLDYKFTSTFNRVSLINTLDIRFRLIFKSKYIRNITIRLWLWLAMSNPGSIKNLIYEDLKRYLFTSSYNQFNIANYKYSLIRYKLAVKLLCESKKKYNKIIILGAGSSAVDIIELLKPHPIKVIALADQNTKKIGSLIHGLPVISLIDALKMNLSCVISPSIFKEEILNDINNLVKKYKIVNPVILSNSMKKIKMQ